MKRKLLLVLCMLVSLCTFTQCWICDFPEIPPVDDPNTPTDSTDVPDVPQPQDFTVGTDLFMTGEGTEADQALKYMDNAVYEIFTYLEADKPFAFYGKDQSGNAAWRFTVNAAQKLVEVKEEVTDGTVDVSGVYRIALDFDKGQAEVAHIDKVILRNCNKDAWDTPLTYVGKGVWEVKNYNVRLTKLSGNVEERYKFIIFEDGVACHWGMAGTFGGRPTLDREGYRDLKKAESKQWAGAFKFPAELVDPNNLFRWYATVTLRMTAEAYTHDFTDIRDGALSYPATAAEWVPAADSLTFILVDQFLNKDRGTFKQNAHHITGQNNSTLYWQQAYPMHTLLYSYERIKESNPALAAEYAGYFTSFVANKGNNYANVQGKKSVFWNEYTDDMAWHCLLQLHAYEVFGDIQYYNNAKVLYDNAITNQNRVKEDEEGWGLIWRVNNAEDADKDTRNACTNTPVMVAACKFHQIETEINPAYNGKYLTQAEKLFDFMTKTGNRVQENGAVAKSPNILTYTQGTWMEATRLLYKITGDTKYMDRATTCVRYTMSGSGACVAAAFGILRGEGQDNNQSNFKGGLIPYMVNYANDETMPADARQEVKDFLQHNARVMWIHGMDKTGYPQCYVNFSWEVPYRVEGNPGSLGATSSGAALLEGVTRLK